MGDVMSFRKFIIKVQTLFLYEIGPTYSIPLFTTNKKTKYLSDAHPSHINKHAIVADKVTSKWWKNQAPKYEYNDILAVDSQKSKDMIFKIGDGQESWI